MQQVSLPDWQTIKQLRLAAKEGLLSKEEFHILLAPQVFIQVVPDGEDLPPGVIRNTSSSNPNSLETEVKVVGFSSDEK